MNAAHDLAPLAERALRASGMDSVGLYVFDAVGRVEGGVILGMPEAFARAYDGLGLRIDPVLAAVRASGAPASTEMVLGARWTASQLYLRVSGRFGLRGFATLPLYRGERLAGIVHLGASGEAARRRLAPEGLLGLTPIGAQLSTALLARPRRHPRLSPRQDAVARLAARGLTNREIAEEIGTGEAAVRKHLKALALLFGTRTRTATAAAWREGGGA